jgi:hypothetical protein
MAGIADLLTLGLPQGNGSPFSVQTPTALPNYGAQAQQSVNDAQPLAASQPHTSKLRNFLGALGDALLVGGGGQPLYQQRQLQQQQTAALQGFLTNPDSAISALMQVPGQVGNAIDLYKAVHPASTHETPVELQEYEFAKSQGFPGSYLDFVQQKGGPLIAANGDGTFTVVPRNMMLQPSAAPSGPPAAAIQYLKAHPETSAQFDQKYGAGASSKVLGGATGSNSSPTFR